MSNNQDSEFGTTHVVCALIFFFVVMVLFDQHFTHGRLLAAMNQTFQDDLQIMLGFFLGIFLMVFDSFATVIGRMFERLVEPLGALFVILLLIPLFRSLTKKPTPPPAKKKGGNAH